MKSMQHRSSFERGRAHVLTLVIALSSGVSAASQAIPAPGAGSGAREGAAAVEAPVTMVHLYDGGILWGQIVGHDAQSLHVLRLDNGGRVQIPWQQLSPALAEDLLDRYGYVDRSGEEILIEADRLFLHDGRDVIGVIQSATEDLFYVQTANNSFPVPKVLVRAVTPVKVNALEVYSREALYAQEVAKLDTTSAEAQWDFAIYCERIFDFEHSIEHLEAARALDPNFKPSEISTALERNRGKAVLQVQLDALREVDMLRARGAFDEALRKVDAFIAANGESPLRADAAKKKAQVVKAREAKMRERAVESWKRWVMRLIDAKARTPGLTLEAALGFLDEGLSNDLVDAVAKEVSKTVSTEATPELMRRYWTERQGGRWRDASYGHGTWLLGEAEARKGLDEEEEKTDDKPLSATDQARKDLEARIKRYLQNQEMVRKAQGGQTVEEDDREAFWAEMGASRKSQWMLAYYVEHSGEFQLSKPRFTLCSDCGGTGVREVVSVRGALNAGNNQGGNRATGGQVSLAKCPTCHHIGVFRRISYR